MTRRVAGHLLAPQGWRRGHLTIDGGRIVGFEGLPVDEATVRGSDLPILLPGFIDAHAHGGGGADVMDASDAVARVARCHAAHGTTALLATTMTAPHAEIEAALTALASSCRERPAQGACVLGVHLEGPYLAPTRLGAQPAFAEPLSLDDLKRWMALAPIRIVTLAPEVPGHLAAIPALVGLGLRVQIGHSDASYDEACAALAAGAAGFTHLFNASVPWHHRAPGVAGAALAHATEAEVIPDLLHVHPGALRAALRAIPGLYAVTDATAAAGMPDGEYRLGRQRVLRCLGAVRLADGTLAGSALTMDQAFANLVSLGLTLAEASARSSTFVARYLGLMDRGRLAAGASADVVVLDRALAVREVLVEGEAVSG